MGQTVAQPFDMVVLSIGITPPASNVYFVEGFEMERTEDGFLMQAQGGAGQNVVIVGTAEGPMDVSESITHAKRGALDLLKRLGAR